MKANARHAIAIFSLTALTLTALAGQATNFRGINERDALKLGLDGFLTASEAKGKKFTPKDLSAAYAFFTESRRLISFAPFDQMADSVPRKKQFMARNEVATALFVLATTMNSTTGQIAKKPDIVMEAEGQRIAAFCGELQFVMMDKTLPAANTVTVAQITAQFNKWRTATSAAAKTAKGDLKQMLDYVVPDQTKEFNNWVKSLSKVDAGSADLFRRMFSHLREPNVTPRPF